MSEETIKKILKEMEQMSKGGEKPKEDPFKAFNDAKAASKMKPIKPIKTHNTIR